MGVPAQTASFPRPGHVGSGAPGPGGGIAGGIGLLALAALTIDACTAATAASGLSIRTTVASPSVLRARTRKTTRPAGPAANATSEYGMPFSNASHVVPPSVVR